MSKVTDCPSEELRLGVIGAGRIAQVAHLPAAVKADRIRLTAICDPSPTLTDALARSYGIAGFTDAEELLAQEIDAVIVAAPDRLHRSLADQALRAGKHVLVEKPLAGTSADAEALAQTAAATGRKLQVGAMKRHDPGIAFAKSVLPRIGQIVTAQCWYRVMAALRPATEATLFPRLVVDEDVRKTESELKAGREHYLLMTHGAHVFDGLRYLAGEVASLRSDLAHVGSDYSWHGTGRLLDSGGLVSFEISANVHAQWSEGFDIYGEKGHIRVTSFFPFFRRASEVTVFTEHDSSELSPVFGDTDPYERQLEAFARAVLDDEPTNPDARDGVAAVRFIEAVVDSAAHSGREVVL